jgi:CBS domain-containing protein
MQRDLDWSGEKRPMLTVADVMCADPVRVREETSVAEAVRLLQSTSCSDLMVVGKGDLWVGVVSEGDLLRACLPAYADLGGRSLVEAGDVLLARAARAANTSAATVMASMQIRRLPVVDGDGRLAGTLARADLIAGLVNHANAGSAR